MQGADYARKVETGVVKTYSLAVSRAKVAFWRMFLRQTIRKKDGKEHRYFTVVVENKRVVGGRVVQRHVLYLGEINDTQELAWRKSIEVFDEGAARPRTLSLFPKDRCEGLLPDASIVRLKLSQVRLHRPRQWGACWLAVTLWRELHLDRFWAERLPASRKGTRWDQVLFVLAACRLLAPGSQWRLHREWFERSALADLLGADFALGGSAARISARTSSVGTPRSISQMRRALPYWRSMRSRKRRSVVLSRVLPGMLRSKCQRVTRR
jgi:hypothetical protein